MHLSERNFSLRFTPPDATFNAWTAELLHRIYGRDAARVKQSGTPDPEHVLTAVAVVEGTTALGRALLYHNPGVSVDGRRTLLIGGYEAVNEAVVGAALLAAIGRYAAENRFARLLGPMDGSTWADYRFVVSPQERPFFTEPLQPLYYAESWRQQGFAEAGTYYSSVAELPPAGAAPEEVNNLLEAEGIAVRPLDLADMAQELRQLYPLVSAAFSRSPYYTPLAEAAFVEKFLQLQTVLDADCTLVARAGGRPVGFVLCLPDYCDPQKETLVLKTIARLPGFDHATLIPRLGELLYRMAANKGYRRMVHAFMQAGNRSRIRSSQFGGTELRQYALFSKPVRPVPGGE